MEKKLNKNTMNYTLQRKIDKIHHSYLNELKKDYYYGKIQMGRQAYIDKESFFLVCELCAEKILKTAPIQCPNSCIAEFAVVLVRPEKMTREKQNIFCADYDWVMTMSHLYLYII